MRRGSWQHVVTVLVFGVIGLLFTWFAAIPMERAYTRWLLADELPACAPAPDGQ